jgi:hypothetical protein
MLLANMFRIVCFTTLAGTISETIVAMYLFGILWDQWSLGLKIATPVLHIAFSAGQLHGSRIFYSLWRKQEKLVKGVVNVDVDKEGSQYEGEGLEDQGLD